MRNLIITKRGTVISEQATDMKTDIGTINAQLNTALNADEKLVVNLIKKYTSDKSTFQNFLNQYKLTTGNELVDVISKSAFQPTRDKSEIDDLNSSLGKIGVTFEVVLNPERTKFIASFKGLDAPASSGTANTDELWKNPKVSCVTTQPGVKPYKTKDGSIVYILGQVVYYVNGRKKLSDGTMGNYSCSTEFKTPNTQKQQQRQQYLKNITNYSNEIQKSLGITPTGKLSNIDLDKIISLL
jgi:hypothetical protein